METLKYKDIISKKIEVMLFYISLFMELLSKYINITGYIKFISQESIKCICLICIFFAITKILLFDSLFWLSHIPFLIFILIITIFAVRSSGLLWYDSVFSFVLLIIAARNIDLADICEAVFIIEIFLIVIALLGYYFRKIYIPPMEPETRNRAYLGFLYPGLISIKFIGTAICGVYARHNKSRKGASLLFVLFIALVNLYFYIETDTRLAFMVVNVFLILYIFIYKLKVKIPKIPSKMIFAFAVVMVGISIVAPLMYDKNNSVWQFINIKLTNTRLGLSAVALKKYKLSLFGQIIRTYNNAEEGYFYIDSGYLHYILVYGLIAISILLFLYCCVYKYAVYKKDWILVIWILLMLLYNLMNEWIISADKCVFAFAIWEFIDLKERKWLVYKKRMFS